MPATHAYFYANLPLFAAVCVVLILGRGRPLGRLALHSGLACLPCSLLALGDRGYWHPARLGGGPAGIEDLIFTFTCGAAVWLCAAWGCGWRLGVPSPVPHRLAARRMLVWGLPSGVLLAALQRAGLDHMSAALLAAISLLGTLLWRRPRLSILGGAGAASFVPVYWAVVRIQFACFPGYPAQWNPRGPWAPAVLGVPAGELAWAAVFALLWPVLTASAFEVEVGPAGAAGPSAGG